MGRQSLVQGILTWKRSTEKESKNPDLVPRASQI